MKNVLYTNPKMEVRRSNKHGYGMFSTADIKKGEILEECHYTEVPMYARVPNIYTYYWPKDINDDRPRKPYRFRAFVFGFASLYNTAKNIEDKMVSYYTDEVNNLFIFQAVKDIKKDQEILSWYKAINSKTTK